MIITKIKTGTRKVLIADDDPPTRILLKAAVSQWGYEVIEAHDGEEAWNILQQEDAPKLAIIDWIMPKLEGADLCTRVRKQLVHQPYMILLTQVTGTANIVKGLDAGADEFLSKPFNMAELKSRLSVGARMINFAQQIAEKTELEKKYVTYTQTLSTLVFDLALQAEEIIESKVVATCVKDNQEVQQKIKELKASREYITAVINQFRQTIN